MVSWKNECGRDVPLQLLVTVRGARGEEIWRPQLISKKTTVKQLTELANDPLKLERGIAWLLRDERTGRLLREELTLGELWDAAHPHIELAAHPDPILG